MSEQSVNPPDSLIGVRDCGCITAWMALEYATKHEIREFATEMALSGREVRRVRLDDVRDKIGSCSTHMNLSGSVEHGPPLGAWLEEQRAKTHES